MTSTDPEAVTESRRAPLADVALDQRFDLGGLYSLRAAVVAHASELGLSDHGVENLMIIASELATNAVAHGGGGGRLQLWRDADLLRCQVSDSGPGLADPQTAGIETPPPSAPSGRGLWIARTLSEEIDIVSGAQGTTVTIGLLVN